MRRRLEGHVTLVGFAVHIFAFWFRSGAELFERLTSDPDIPKRSGATGSAVAGADLCLRSRC